MKPVKFKEIKDWQGFKLYKGEKEFPAIFTNSRVDKESAPAGLYQYDIRGGDTEDFCTVEDFVAVNHTGTIFTKEPIPFGKKGYFDIEARNNDYSFDDECLDEFSMYIDI